MAGRIRTIKPEMLEDERTAGLSDRAFRLWIGMLMLADDTGRLRADPRYLLGHVFWCAPGYEDSAKAREDLARAREELLQGDLVLAYRVRGQEYAVIRSWRKHQKIDHPSAPKCPGPDEADPATPVRPATTTKPLETQEIPTTPLLEEPRPVETDLSHTVTQFDEPSRDPRSGLGRDREGNGEDVDRLASAREGSRDPREDSTRARETSPVALTDGTKADDVLGDISAGSGGMFQPLASPDNTRRFLGKLRECKATRQDCRELGEAIAKPPKWMEGSRWRQNGAVGIPLLLSEQPDDQGNKRESLLVHMLNHARQRRAEAEKRLREEQEEARIRKEEASRKAAPPVKIKRPAFLAAVATVPAKEPIHE